MPAVVIDGAKIAREMKEALKRDIADVKAARGRVPQLAVLQIKKHASSDIYIKALMNLAEEIGLKMRAVGVKPSQSDVEREIAALNADKTVSGIMVQTPVPEGIELKKLFAAISPDKDAEGLNPSNAGGLIYGTGKVVPCTPAACMALIDSVTGDLRGKEVVIVGHSEIVGRPLSLMMLSRMATTTVCHIGTYEKGRLEEHVRRAEILVVSVGKPFLIKGDWIREGAVVIDVGINKYKGRITGDVDFEAAKKKASYITPVPGGVGPLTALMLMRNLAALCKR